MLEPETRISQSDWNVGWYSLWRGTLRLDHAAAAAKSLQSCPTLCDPIDGSPPGSAVPGILQARTLEWVAISFSNSWKGKVKVKSLSRVRLFATLWSAAYQAPPSIGFSRQEYWSRVPLPSPRFLGSKQQNRKFCGIMGLRIGNFSCHLKQDIKRDKRKKSPCWNFDVDIFEN